MPITANTRTTRLSRLALASATSFAMLISAACSSDSEDASSGDTATEAVEGAVRVAFAYGYGGGGPEGEFIAGLNCYASENGLPEVTVTYADADPSKMLSDFDSLVARAGELEGIFALPNDPVAAAPAYKAAQEAGIVVIDPTTPDADGNYPTEADSHIAPDDPNLAEQVLTDMAADDSSIKKIAILTTPPGQAMTDAKNAAFQKLGADFGIEVVELLTVEDMSTDGAQQVTEDFLTRNKDIQAIFAHNGAMGRGAALAAKSQGVELKVYSVDSDEETISAVKAGQIFATYGADLFQVAYDGSKEVESIKKGNKPAPKVIPYTRFDASNATYVPVEERCK